MKLRPPTTPAPEADGTAHRPWAAGAAAILGAASFASMAWIVATSHQPLPVWDEWLMLIQLEPALVGGLSPRLLLRHFYEHLVVSQRLVAYLDHAFLGGQNVLPKVANLAVQLLHALLLIALIRRRPKGGGPDPGRPVAAGLLVALMFSAQHTIVLRSGFQFSMVSTLAAVTAAAWAWSRAADPRGRSPVPYAALAVAAGLAAATCFGSGLLIWPALLMTGAMARVRWPLLTAPVLGLTLSLAAHRVDPVPLGHGGVLTPMLEQPALVALRAIALVGTPARGLGTAAGLAFGVVGAAAGLTLLVWMVRRRPRGAEIVHGSLLLFLGGSLTLAASARSNLGLGQAFKERYGLFAMLFWIALLMTWRIRRHRAPATWGRFGDGAAVAAVALLLVTGAVAHVEKLRTADLWPRHFDHGAAALRSGVDDGPLLADIGLKTRRVREGDAILRRHRLSIYRNPPVWALGSSAPPYDRAPADACLGRLTAETTVRPKGGPGGAGLRLDGWAWDRAAGAAPREIFVVDAGGRLAGYGSGGDLRRKVARRLDEVTSTRSGWRAYGGGTGPFTLDVLLADGRLCRLDTP
ncbi:MAG: hypothetical protein AAGN66_05265 [Acidobacteriota bacterium]